MHKLKPDSTDVIDDEPASSHKNKKKRPFFEFLPLAGDNSQSNESLLQMLSRDVPAFASSSPPLSRTNSASRPWLGTDNSLSNIEPERVFGLANSILEESTKLWSPERVSPRFRPRPRLTPRVSFDTTTVGDDNNVSTATASTAGAVALASLSAAPTLESALSTVPQIHQDCVRRHLLRALPIAICRPLLFDALRSVADQPKCVVVTTLGPCWVATPSDNAHKPVDQSHTYHLFLNTKKYDKSRDWLLVVAHPRDTKLLPPTAQFKVQPVEDTVTYFDNLSNGIREIWGWGSMSEMLSSVSFSVIGATDASWASAQAHGDGSNPITIFATKNGANQCACRVVHSSRMPPADHVVVAPHARQLFKKNKEKSNDNEKDKKPRLGSWTWPESCVQSDD